ncbi:MAG: (d)CMP kinase [Holosporales bacterium]|nr:(d)CMP kinase [Holosporales bacterium]
MPDSSHRPYIIAIDGPAGSGKGTVAAALARHLGFSYVETGSFFRILAWRALDEGCPLQDGARLQAIVDSAWFQKKRNSIPTQGLREEYVGLAASEIAKIPRVRAAFTAFQRQTVLRLSVPGVVIEGRDTGTALFPDADCKIFLTASPEVRAQRRFLELKHKDKTVPYGQVLQDLCMRDRNDCERALAPLRPDETYQLLDTSSLSIEQTVDAAEATVRKTLPATFP